MDDQQAREAAAKAYAENGPIHAEWDRMSPNMQERTLERVGRAIDAYLAALPVASRSDIPQQPTQANRMSGMDLWTLMKQLEREAVNEWGELPDDDHTRWQDIFDAKVRAALVSSPSELSAASKETVTPAREAILREATIREVLAWFDQDDPESWTRPALLRAAEHFGVKS